MDPHERSIIAAHGYLELGMFRDVWRELHSLPAEMLGRSDVLELLALSLMGERRWGEALEFTAEAGPGDFIYVPPYVPHQEINASRDEVLECVLVRSDGQAVAINLDIEPVEKPETVLWIDPVHRDPAETK